jgi:serine O-acetyltransferase
MQGGELWEAICGEARLASRDEPTLASFYYSSILNHPSMGGALAFNLAMRLDSPSFPAVLVRDVFLDLMAGQPGLLEAIEADCAAYYERDPACDRYLMPLLFFKGYQAVQAHRLAHELWQQGRRALALYLQNRIASTFNVDLHPAARLGRGLMMDHATGVVIGETAVVGDNVSMLHEVVLGGSGCGGGQRHPQIEEGVLLGAGAILLGSIRVGEGSKVGSGSVVLADVPPHTTVAGVPARVVGTPLVDKPALAMNQRFDLPPAPPRR